MKKKAGWKTLAGLGAAALAFLRLSEDLPVSGEIIAPPFKPVCKDGERLSWDASAKRWVCVPRL